MGVIEHGSDLRVRPLADGEVPAAWRPAWPTTRPSKSPTRGRHLDAAYDVHRNNFGFLRFALATMVIWSHSYALAGRPADPLSALSGQIDGGNLAVDGFFVLSGFLVTQSWLQQPAVGAFAAKRLLRLMPALLVATVFGAFVVAPFGTTMSFGAYVGTPGPWLHFLGVPLNRYLFIPTVFADNPIPNLVNSPLWSLRYEMLCYALVAVLGVTGGRRLGPVALLVFTLSWLAYVCRPASIPLLSVPSQTARLLACFSAGMILFVYRARVPFSPGLALAAFLVLVATAVAGGLRVALPWAGAYLLLYVACLRGLRLENFCRYGDFSYGLYVFACPVQQLLLSRLGPQLPVAQFFLLAFLPTLGLAALSWHLVEGPALNLKRGLMGRGR